MPHRKLFTATKTVTLNTNEFRHLTKCVNSAPKSGAFQCTRTSDISNLEVARDLHCNSVMKTYRIYEIRELGMTVGHLSLNAQAVRRYLKAGYKLISTATGYALSH